MTLKPEILRPKGAANLIFVCDHASNHIPAEYGALGLTPAHLQEHIAYDIGAAGITRGLSAELDAPAVLAPVSRLLIDVNRTLDAPTLIPEVSDGVPIPGNRALKPRERQARIRNFYEPYHAAVDVLVRARRNMEPWLIGIHTFTPVFGGKARALEAAVLWNKDERLAIPVGKAFEDLGLKTGWNEPYSGREFFETLDRHGGANGLPHVTIEVRQDLVENAAGERKFTNLIAGVLRGLIREGL